MSTMKNLIFIFSVLFMVSCGPGAPVNYEPVQEPAYTPEGSYVPPGQTISTKVEDGNVKLTVNETLEFDNDQLFELYSTDNKKFSSTIKHELTFFVGEPIILELHTRNFNNNVASITEFEFTKPLVKEFIDKDTYRYLSDLKYISPANDNVMKLELIVYKGKLTRCYLGNKLALKKAAVSKKRK